MRNRIYKTVLTQLGYTVKEDFFKGVNLITAVDNPRFSTYSVNEISELDTEAVMLNGVNMRQQLFTHLALSWLTDSTGLNNTKWGIYSYNDEIWHPIPFEVQTTEKLPDLYKTDGVATYQPLHIANAIQSVDYCRELYYIWKKLTEDFVPITQKLYRDYPLDINLVTDCCMDLSKKLTVLNEFFTKSFVTMPAFVAWMEEREVLVFYEELLDDFFGIFAKGNID